MSISIFVSDSIPDPRWLEHSACLLSGHERSRAGRLYGRIRERFIWRRIMRRLILGRLIGVDPSVISFSHRCAYCGSDAHGKPRLSGSLVEFSASQSDDLTVLGVSKQRIGVDVQSLHASLHDLPDYALCSSEKAAYASSHDRRWSAAVLWSRKEAVLKAIGIGLAVEPRNLDVDGFNASEGHVVEVKYSPCPGWRVSSWRCTDDGTVAVACQAEPMITFVAFGPPRLV